MGPAPTIEQLTSIGDADRAGLVTLLIDSVADNASVGFLAPLSVDAATAYWSGLVPGLARGSRLLFVARDAGRIVGSVQLALAGQANGAHRAEVQKLLVHTSARRRGLGSELMRALERAAIQAGRTLLVLDTRVGDPASRLYERLGYVLAGDIPAYARSSNGSLDGSAFFYRRLEDESA